MCTKKKVVSEWKEYCHHFCENNTGLNLGDSQSTILFNLALQKVIGGIKMVRSGTDIGKEQWNVLTYADNIALIRKK